MQKLGLIKVCPDPQCEAVWHNCPKKHTKCKNCGGNIMQINEDTFWKKFSNNWFQYNFTTGEYYRPVQALQECIKPIVETLKIANGGKFQTCDFYNAVYQSVKWLLYRRFYDVNKGELTEPCITAKTVIDALNKAIRLGGGHTLNPHVGNYWLFEYYPGIKASLSKTEGGRIVEEKVTKAIIIEIATKCFNEHKRQNEQLSLF